jgi:two-component system, NtrC family, sensor kinase
MKRRSRAGSEPTKGRHQKAPEPKRGNAPKPAPRSNSAPEETEVARLTRELGEAAEQQTATSQVLNAISRSTFDLPTVLSTLVETAARLCRADKVQILLPSENSNRVYSAASFGYSGEYDEYLKTITFAPGREGVAGRVLLERKPVQIADVLADPEYRLPEVQRLGGFRTHLGLPLLREDSIIGVLLVSRTVVEPFDDKHIELLSTFAAQAVIAIENARLLNELRQSLEQQTATSQVLQVISSSPGDLEPVFRAMLDNATRICEAKFGVLFRFDGHLFEFAAEVGTPPELLEFQERRGPFRPPSGSRLERVMLTKQVIDTLDDAAEPVPSPAVKLGGARSVVDVPMLKDDELIGVVAIFRQEVRPFSEKQIALVQNFAAQAVIAIENARLLSELRRRTDDLSRRTTDLSEALEQQTATSEILQVISSSPGDLQPVFHAMLRNAVRICDAKFGFMFGYNGEAFHMTALLGAPPEYADTLQRIAAILPGPDTALGRVAKTKQVAQITDAKAERAYAERDPIFVAAVEKGGVRTILGVPMIKDDKLIGAILIYRQEVRPFADKQITLLQNFATQAVIAIENTRVLNELRQRTTDLSEALEQQTATSEVLQVISSSPGDLQPVFETMLANAVRICDAKWGNIHRWDGDALHLLAAHNTPPAFAETRGRSPNYPASDTVFFGRVIATKMVAHVADAAAERPYIERSNPAFVAAVELGGARTSLAVPMLKENELIGTLALARQEVRPFTDKQIELVKNFAAQAVIAIENAAAHRRPHRAHRRPHRGARAADGHVGRTPSYLWLSRRASACVCNDAGKGGPHLRSAFWFTYAL